MTTDVKFLRDFLGKMDYEGGIEGIIGYGVDATGDARLDQLFEEAENVIDAINLRIRQLEAEYGEALYPEEEE